MFWRVLKWLINSKIAQLIAVVLAYLAYNKTENWQIKREGKREGKEQERQDAQEKDRANAKAIRDRVDDVKPSKLRPDDRRGYRD